MATEYHMEWLRLMKQNRHRRWEFLNQDIVEPVLSKNEFYYRCRKRKNNAGICRQVQEFRGYVDQQLQPPKEPALDYGEMAYALWLLGIKCAEHERTLQRRVNEFFKGSTYYESNLPGFRQLLYEVHGICRLVEAGITFDDLHDEEAEPDLFVRAEEASFYLEVKLPVTNLRSCIDKAFKQLRPDERPRTALIAGLDSVLALAGEEGRQAALKACIAETDTAVKGRRTAIALEFPADGTIEGGVDVYFAVDGQCCDAAVRRVLESMLLQESWHKSTLWQSVSSSCYLAG